MKKVLLYILLFIVSGLVIWLNYDKLSTTSPKLFYRVYLDDQVIGKIKSKKELENYFYEKGQEIKNNLTVYKQEMSRQEDINLLLELINKGSNIKQIKEYILIEHPNINGEVNNIVNFSNDGNILENLNSIKLSDEEEIYKSTYIENFSIYEYSDDFYIPTGVDIKKIYTYDNSVSDVESVYNKIQSIKSTSILVYRISIKSEDKTQYLYTIDRKIFEDAIQLTVSTFIGKENYELYINDEQLEIVTTGTIIEEVYIEENITIKEMKCSVSEKIYTSAEELSQYLLFGDKENSSVYTVKLGDTIESVAINNKVNVEEIFMSNPEFTSVNNILSIGRKIVINELNPKLSVVVIRRMVEEQVNKYTTEEIIDENRAIGNDEIIQRGVDGLDRLTLRIYAINGQEVNVDTIQKEVIKEPVNERKIIGKKYISIVGSTDIWRWPTRSGYHISTYWGYRTHPIGGYREFHRAIDIAGPGLNSPIYAANNGVIETASYTRSYGNYIIINHNNGYYTLYAHMNYLNKSKGQTVSKGDIIGFMGRTGSATGVHLHFEVWYGGWWSGTSINPLTLRYQ